MLIVGSCSSTKRYPVPPQLDAGSIRARTLVAYADQWLDRIEAQPPAAAALQVYGGAGHAALSLAATESDSQLIFVSAGLGVVRSGEQIPSYNLTVSSRGPGPFARSAIQAKPRDWWAVLHRARTRGSPLADFIRRHDDIVVLALPMSYLAMVQDDLAALGARQVSKLRILASQECRLPEELAPQMILYDNRLAFLGDGFSGGMSSLIQRAAHHFLCEVLPDRRINGIDGQRRRVQTILSAQKQPKRVERRKVSDLVVTKHIRRMLAGAETKAPVTSALQQLRHEHGIACEQARFAKLYQKVTSGKS